MMRKRPELPKKIVQEIEKYHLSMQEKIKSFDRDEDLGYWYKNNIDSVDNPISVNTRKIRGYSKEQEMSEFLWGHDEEYELKMQGYPLEEKEEFISMRIISFGALLGFYDEIIEKLNSLSNRENIDLNEIIDRLELELVHCKARLYGSIKFALRNKISKKLIKDWYYDFEDNNQLYVGSNPMDNVGIKPQPKKPKTFEEIEAGKKEEFISKNDEQKHYNDWSKIDNSIYKHVEKSATDLEQEIEFEIKFFKKQRNESEGNLYELGKKLYRDSLDSLSLLKKLLGETDLKYKMIADNLAKEVMQCGIDYFNEFKDVKDPSEESLELILIAKSFAKGQSMVDRANDNYEAIKEWSEVGIVSSDIEFLEKIINNWEENIKENSKGKMRINGANETLNLCLPKLTNLQEQLGIDDETYIKFSSAIVNMCMNTIIEFLNLRAEWASQGYMTSEDEKSDNLNKAMRDITGSFDWNLVKQYKTLMKEAISLMNRLSELKISPESRKYFQENRQKIIQNELKYRTVPHSQKQAEFVAKRKAETSDTGGCYIATMAYGDYDHPKVLELRKFRDNVLLKNYFGKIFVKIYYLLSPSMVEKFKNKTRLNKIIIILLDQLVVKLRKSSFLDQKNK